MVTVGPAQALDGASRFFVGGSCPFTLFTPPPNSYFLYSYPQKQSPPPECRGVVQIGANQTVNWIADKAPSQNTTFSSGIWGYNFDWALEQEPSVDAILGFDSLCYSYEIRLGMLDSFGTFTSVGGVVSEDFPYPPFNNGTIQGTTSLSSFVVPAGYRLGVAFEFRGGGGCPPAVLNLTTASSVWLDATTSDPPYPLSGPSSAVPTLTQWGLLLMSILIAMGGVWAVRTRAKA